MKRTSWIGCAALALACVGCEQATDQQAKLLIRPVGWIGRAMEWCAGPAERLEETGRIDAHRRVEVEEGVEIDVWLIKSRLYDESAGNKGSIFEGRLTRGTVVLLHPMLTGKAWFLGMGERMAKRGWDVVLMDLRGHGFSDGEYTTWGVREKQDVKKVVDEILAGEAVSGNVYACGSSAGGSIAIQYAAIDPRCKGVVAVAPPAGAVGIFRRILCLLAEPYFQRAVKRAGEMADFDPADASAVAAAKKLKCPLVVIHGSWDLLVPFQNGERIFQAAGSEKKRLIPLKYVGHISEIGRTGWLTDQMDTLADMSHEKAGPVRTVARTRWRSSPQAWVPEIAGRGAGFGPHSCGGR